MPAQEPLDETTSTTSDGQATQSPSGTGTPEATDGGAPGDTVGTGSVIALGCIGGTLFLIVIGLIYLLAVQIF